ncbi:MAG: hypothetical protein EA398_17335 [Deltaproteobacteria bacterium]|nr:MAG: hypothetical protein EA398_17335 [Deltaproteobacteria bacterium]
MLHAFLAILLLGLLALALNHLLHGLAPALPAPTRCRDCFDDDELVLYTLPTTCPEIPREHAILLKRCALLAAALRHDAHQRPEAIELRRRILRTASALPHDHRSREPLARLAARAVRLSHAPHIEEST